MYTVLIAEEELLVRMGIASSVPWALMNMRVVAETADGGAAWKAFEKYHPDIVIADIRMPKLDGMELLRRIRAVDADCAVIIVTNVEHGLTLDEARRLGITDVLIKAAMKRDDITNAVLKAREALPQGRGSAAQPADNAAMWREFLSDPEAAGDALRERCCRAGAAFFEPKGFAYLYICDDGRLSHRLKSSLVNLFAHRLNESGEFCIVEMKNGGVAALARNEYDGGRVERTLSDLGRYVRDNFGTELRFAVRCGDFGLDALRMGMERAERYCREPALFDRNLLMLDAAGRPGFSQFAEAARMLRRSAVLGVRSAELVKRADGLEKIPEELARSGSVGLKAGNRVLTELGGSAGCEGAHALADAILQAARGAVQAVESAIRPEIRAAIDYIEDHLSDELSIRHVSEIAGYHPAYFSNLFKRELGMSYSDFLAGLRIQRAKEMLSQSSQTLQQIADACGFSDLSYFSVKFKRVVGMTPSQWRTKT